ncbi:ogr/Delta-like zinc finger family protein [Marinobacter nauticus]|uniref:ogr/Delta-like zinc finger family protein n=1 Tax=Marinobacter nauticus TaxID=2743 RepID=UPI001C990941|nr:ogr/Delta-like zinc finger family protein [Marinobacter nauticus]MBY5938030.1 ogr/Delta-like zinc finger family protein [Marinobacter nauticus]MBY5955259.1 ogr/Delta-like zinc finger family protein [Marinobacter nauticus]MBY6009050.1 ogr/Delta-like zinc finger family protein [Marinobacter nauticus]
MNLSQIKRNYLTMHCPACGEACQIQSSKTIQDKGKDALVRCRNLECGYQGTLKLSYGPVLAAKNPRQPEEAMRTLSPGVRNSFIRILCPHCGGVCRIRTSVQVINAQRTAYVFCQNEDHCGYRGVVFLTHDTRMVPDGQGRLKSIPLNPETAAQVQQDMEFTFRKHQQTNNEDR